MSTRERLPARELVFIKSLVYHGFRMLKRRSDLKRNRGYIIPSTKREDGDGIDFWVKMPGDYRIFPIQLTQRGVRLYRKHSRPEVSDLSAFVVRMEKRIKRKAAQCRDSGVAFVLVRDYDGTVTNPTLAWGDIKALRYGIAHLKRWLL